MPERVQQGFIACLGNLNSSYSFHRLLLILIGIHQYKGSDQDYKKVIFKLTECLYSLHVLHTY